MNQVRFPFVRCQVELWDGKEGTHFVDSWKPGTREVMYGPESTESVADAARDFGHRDMVGKWVYG